MPTNKIALRTVEEFMSDYTPIYQPIYPLFLGGKSQGYDREVGKLDFKRIQTVGDVRAKHITPKDTEIRQVSVMEGKKSFKKYFMANQFTLSEFQDRQGVEEVVAQVLDEHQLQADELLMLGDGTSNSDVINNGLFFSNDANYILKSSVEISATDRLFALHSAVVATAQQANQVAGRKVIFLYGDAVMPLSSSLYPTAVRGWRSALLETLGANYSIVEIPAASTPAGANGWIIANMDQCKLHYTDLPQLMNEGENEEKMYLWFNFILGSMMLEVLARGGVIRQPVTFA